MQYRHELVRLEDGLNAKISVHSVLDVIAHWHYEIEILMVLEGEVKVKREAQTLTLKQNDLCLINSNELHRIKGNEDNIVLAIQFSPALLSFSYPDLKNVTFDCCSVNSSESEQRVFDLLRCHLAKLTLEFTRQQAWFKFSIETELYSLLGSLLKMVPYECLEEKQHSTREKELERLTRIITFIGENYQNKVQLQEIAAHECISLFHLSRFFKERMGLSFQEYLFEFRTYQSAKQLLQTEKTIADVAADCGFTDIKLFYKKFKLKYQCTPASFRKQHSTTTTDVNQSSYLAVDNQRLYSSLFKYLQKHANSTSNVAPIHVSTPIQIPSLHSEKAMTPSWNKLLTFGCAYEGLKANLQRHLSEIQNHLGFEYARFQGIFNDQMQVVAEDGSFSWFYTDELFDFLLSIGLKPFLCLGYMPEAFASSDKTIAFWKGNISPPTHMEKWCQLVEAFCAHLIERYGREEVCTWYFEVWNEPDLEGVFWDSNQEQYQELYTQTYYAMRKVEPALKIGGPSVSHLTVLESDWLKSFVQFCNRKNLQPDFFSFHVYPERYEILKNMGESNNQGEAITLTKVNNSRRITMDKHGSQSIVDDIISTLQPLNTRDYHVTEWNLSACWGNPVLDTAYSGSFITYNVIKLWDKVQSLGVWTCSDLFDERGPARETFHGGFGLQTKEGLKKPSYHALSLCKKMGHELLLRGEDYLVCRSQEQIQILMVNYVHFDRLYSNGDISALEQDTPYAAFNDVLNKVFQFKLPITAQRLKLTRYTLDRTNGSVYDLWQEMGSPSPLSQEDTDELQRLNMPQRKVNYIERLNQELLVESEVVPHGVELVIIDLEKS